MASFAGHFWGGMIATGLAIVAILIGLYQTDLLKPYIETSEWFVLPALLAIGLFSAFFPDIDIHSKSQRAWYALMLLTDLVLIAMRDYKAAALLGILAMIPPLSKHRGWTHTWLAAFIVPAIFFFVLPLLMHQRLQPFLVICYIVSVSGYISHLALDGYIGTTARRVLKLLGR